MQRRTRIFIPSEISGCSAHKNIERARPSDDSSLSYDPLYFGRKMKKYCKFIHREEFVYKLLIQRHRFLLRERRTTKNWPWHCLRPSIRRAANLIKDSPICSKMRGVSQINRRLHFFHIGDCHGIRNVFKTVA